MLKISRLGDYVNLIASIKCEVGWVSYRPDGLMEGANHYKVTLSRRPQGALVKMVCYYSEGIGIKREPGQLPTLADILPCLISDARCASCLDYDSLLDIQEFMNEFGYDDTLEAHKILKACSDTLSDLGALFTGVPGLKSLDDLTT